MTSLPSLREEPSRPLPSPRRALFRPYPSARTSRIVQQFLGLLLFQQHGRSPCKIEEGRKNQEGLRPGHRSSLRGRNGQYPRRFRICEAPQPSSSERVHTSTRYREPATEGGHHRHLRWLRLHHEDWGGLLLTKITPRSAECPGGEPQVRRRFLRYPRGRIQSRGSRSERNGLIEGMEEAEPKPSH